jgi:hypothetical protein
MLCSAHFEFFSFEDANGFGYSVLPLSTTTRDQEFLRM